MMKQNTPDVQLRAFIDKQIERKERVFIETLNYVGQTCVNEARSNGDYIDQTGNLRSSIGYMVIRNGQVLHKGGFELVKNGNEGIKDGPAFIESMISKNSKGIVLIIVAGMNYAAYVEDMGRNVLTTSELLAEQLVPKMLKDVGFKR